MAWFWGLLEGMYAEAGAVASIIAVAGAALAWLRKPWKKPEEVSLDKPTREALTPKDDGKLNVADFIRIRREMKADLQSEFADPDAALAEAQSTIADLKTRLERKSNDIGGERLKLAY